MKNEFKDRSGSGMKLFNYWKTETERCFQWHEKWRTAAKQVIERYYGGKRQSQTMMPSDSVCEFNILWANTEVLAAATLQQSPKPSVTRRFKDRDPISREVAEILERALLYSQDQYDFKGELNYVNKDNLLPGFGQVRVRYEAQTEEVEQREYLEPIESLDDTGEPFYTFARNGVEVEPEMDEVGFYVTDKVDQLAYEAARCEQIPWDRFYWEPGRKWSDVTYCVVELMLDRDQLVEEFGSVGHDIQLTHVSEGLNSLGEHEADKARVYEIWDKRNRRTVFISDGYSKGPIDVRDDELKLEGFWPWPEPYWATITSKTLIPVADFLFYQEQAAELDEITARIEALVDSLRVRGIYDATFQELEKLLNKGDNALVPVQDFSTITQGRGDINSAVSMLDISKNAQVLASLYQARDQVKTAIYEITGISDIVRGQSMASETATAQRIKGQYANLRLNQRVERLQTFISGVYQIKAEIIANHFQTETLQMITGKEITPEIEQVLRSDVLRSYKVDVESDSMLVSDEEEDKQSRIEFMQAFQQALGTVLPMIQGGLSMDLAREMLMFTVRGFKQGRDLEDAIDSAFAQMVEQQQMAAQQQAMMAQQQQMLPAPAPAPASNVVPFQG